MAQILVRNLKKRVLSRLKDRAKKEHRSLQAEVKSILERVADEPVMDMALAKKLSQQFQSKFAGRKFPPSIQFIREDRNR